MTVRCFSSPTGWCLLTAPCTIPCGVAIIGPGSPQPETPAKAKIGESYDDETARAVWVGMDKVVDYQTGQIAYAPAQTERPSEKDGRIARPAISDGNLTNWAVAWNMLNAYADQLERELADTTRRFAEHRKLNAALGSLPSATQRSDALERLYRSVLVEDRGHGRETYRLDQVVAGEALSVIAAIDGSSKA